MASSSAAVPPSSLISGAESKSVTTTPTTTHTVVGTVPLTSSGDSKRELPRDVADPDAVPSIKVKAKAADARYDHHQVEVMVTPNELTFGLKPTHCGPKVVYINAQDTAFYSRRLANPKYTCWILCKLTAGESHALKRLFECGWKRNIQVMIMEESKFELVASKDGLEEILYEGTKVALPDCVMTRVGANVGYFGLAVIRHLENLGCLMFNGLKSIEVSRDKLLTVQHLAAHGLPIPKTIVAKFPMNLQTIKREFTYPIIVKKASGSQGIGVIKVDTHEQMEDLVDMLDTGKPLIFQEMITASYGKDLRVFVIGGRVVGAMMRTAAKGNFKANVHQGGTVRKVKLSAQCEWLVLETVRIIGLDIAGVDLLIDNDSYKICEVNSSPGFAGLEIALGVDIAAKMFQYMKMRLGSGTRAQPVHRAPGAKKKIEIQVPVPLSHKDVDLKSAIPTIPPATTTTTASAAAATGTATTTSSPAPSSAASSLSSVGMRALNAAAAGSTNKSTTSGSISGVAWLAAAKKQLAAVASSSTTSSNDSVTIAPLSDASSLPPHTSSGRTAASSHHRTSSSGSGSPALPAGARVMSPISHPSSHSTTTTITH